VKWFFPRLETDAALWAFHDADTFEEAVLWAVKLDDNADTTGATCGQLARAFWGELGIPESLRSGLTGRDLLENALAGTLGSGPT